MRVEPLLQLVGHPPRLPHGRSLINSVNAVVVDRGTTGALATRVVPIRIYIYSALDPKETGDHEDMAEW